MKARTPSPPPAAAAQPRRQAAGRPPGRPAGGDPREGLSRERIVREALALVDAQGLAGFSTRKLGERLGVQAMSLYHHFPSKQHLFDALVDHALSLVAVPPDGLPPLERLRRSAQAYRAMAQQVPALFPLVAIHRLNTAQGVRFIESLLSMVHAVVPDDELAARHFRAIGYFLAGCGIDETSGYARGPSAAEPVGADEVARCCPRLTAAAPYFQRSHWDRTFELGLQALLDAAARDGRRLRSTRRVLRRGS